MKKIIRKQYLSQAMIFFVLAILCLIPGSAALINDSETGMQHTASFGGSIIYVDDDNINGPWDGSIDHPFQFIQDGIDHATDGDTVIVFDGTYKENVVVTQSIDLKGDNKSSMIVGYSHSGTIMKIVAENVTLSGFTISYCGNQPNNAGIMIHSSHNVITNNDICENENFGLYVIGPNNLIYHNNFMKNTYQAFDLIAGSMWDDGYPSGGNYWDEYSGIDEDEDGIGEIPYPTGNSSADHYPLVHPYGSVCNIDTEEIFLTIQAAIADCDTQAGHTIVALNGLYREHLSVFKSVFLFGNHGDTTIIEAGSSGDVVTLCADDVHFEGFMIQHSGTEEHNAGVVVSGNNCSIIKNTLYDNFQGIILEQSVEQTMIRENKISDSRWNGVILKPECTDNYVIQNTITNSFYAGLGSTDTSHNYIYHNTFKSNRHQAYDEGTNIWDDGYPSGGNYWSDYIGSDDDGDGIGDIPYEIPDGINSDRYPLMSPYTEEDTIPPVVTIETPTNGVYLWGLHMFSGLLKRNTVIYGPIMITVHAADAHSGIAQVEFFLDNSLNPEFTDDQEPYSWEWSKPYLLMRKHTIIVIAYDNAGNTNYDMLEVRKYL
jgi:parallel beta-helix repeat protein